MGFSPERNSCSHGHSFWEVVNSGQEMSWHFGLGVVTLLSLSQATENWTRILSHGKGKASVILVVGTHRLSWLCGVQPRVIRIIKFVIFH